MRKRIALITVVAVCVLMLLTACSGKISKDKVWQDIEQVVKEELSSSQTIKDIEILETRSDKKKSTSVSVKVITQDEVAEYVDYFMACYYYSVDKEYIFDTVFQIDKDKSTITPIKGVTQGIAVSSLKNKSIGIGDETWSLNDVTDVSIESQETNLNEKTDDVTMSLTVNDKVQQAKGKLKLEYKFTDEWELTSVSQDGEFTVSDKPECALELTDEDLLAELVKNEVTLFDDTSNSQTLSMTEAEISDFEVYEESVEQRGATRKYFCKATLTKPNAKITLDAQIRYIFEGSWLLQPMTITAELESIDIEGKWEGKYDDVPYDGKASLEITEVTDNGKVTGIYSYTPDTITKSSQAGSYKVSGTIDMTCLKLDLTGGDWVVKDSSHLAIYNKDIIAYFNVDEGTLVGKGYEYNVFVLTKAEG